MPDNPEAKAADRQRQRDAMQPEFRRMAALEQIADALEAMRADISQIRVSVGLLVRHQISRP